MKLIRVRNVHCSEYRTTCGRFHIHRECYPPYRWYVNEYVDGKCQDAYPADGYKTLREARFDVEKELNR